MPKVLTWSVAVLAVIGIVVAATHGRSNSSGLTAFGASVASWNSHHQADSNFLPGTAYDPTPGLGIANGSTDRYNDRYYAVDTTGGPVLDYSMRLYPGTRISRARATAMREFPPDTHVQWFTTKRTCAQMVVSSATLSKAYGHPVVALIEFSHGNSYSPGNVTDMLLIGLPPTRPGSAPNC